MNNALKHSCSLLMFAFLLIVLAGACKPQYDYTIKGKVVKATTGEPLEGVVVEVFHDECSGYGFNGGCAPADIRQTTTNAKEEFEIVLTSEKSGKEIKFSKEFMRTFYSGTNGGSISSGTNILNEVSMYAKTEEFTIEFEPILSNVKEVTLDLEWLRRNGLPNGDLEEIDLGIFSSHFGITNYVNYPHKRVPIGIGEQWLKMNFDILLEDNSRLQKTDSIWLPGRYYDINDYDFDDPRKYPVYKFSY